MLFGMLLLTGRPSSRARSVIALAQSIGCDWEPAATGNLQFAENRVEMLFHGFETQATRVGDLLIAAPIAHQTRQMLFSLREPRQMRQGAILYPRTACGAPAQAFEFNEKMRPRDGG